MSKRDPEQEKLFQAFVAGFMQSGEGGNAEYPHHFDRESVEEHLRPKFEEWHGELPHD